MQLEAYRAQIYLQEMGISAEVIDPIWLSPLDYGTITHHSDMDTYDHALPADLMQAAAVIATCVYEAANAPEMMPRRELPPAEATK